MPPAAERVTFPFAKSVPQAWRRRLQHLGLAALLLVGIAEGLAAQSAVKAGPPPRATPEQAKGLGATAPLSWLESPHLFRASEWLLVGAAGFDYGQTMRGMSKPSILHLTVSNAWETHTVDLDFSSSIAEGGWAKVVGAHNIGGVVAANIGLDLLVDLAARRLARRGPGWRLVAAISLWWRSWAHIEGGRSWLGLNRRLAAPYSQFDPVWIH